MPPARVLFGSTNINPGTGFKISPEGAKLINNSMNSKMVKSGDIVVYNGLSNQEKTSNLLNFAVGPPDAGGFFIPANLDAFSQIVPTPSWYRR